jgi:hypothetical protein
MEITNVNLGWRRYSPWLGNEYDPAMGITYLDFQRYLIQTSRGVESVQSMLSMFELALLYGVCRHYYAGRGAIIDAGPLLGAGTYAMAHGLVDNHSVADKRKRIYSFDLWMADGMGNYVEGWGQETGSVFERWRRITSDYQDQINASPGDLSKMRWRGGPVEVLFIDLAKTEALNAWVLRNWFVQLFVGSVVIQQDYAHFGEPWIAVTMEYFREHFELIEFVYGSSAVYRCVEPITKDRVESFLNLGLTDYNSLMLSAIEGAPPSVAQVLYSAMAWLKRDTPLDALRILNEVRPVGNPDKVQDFSEIAAGNVIMVRDLLSHQVTGHLG